MKIALLGHGVVGRGVDEIIASRAKGVEVARILELPDRLSDPRMTANYDDILHDPEIELVIECMGGLEPAHTFIMSALNAGKSVVTSNKAVVAAYFEEFAAAAREHGAALLIEASCGGGIPWIASIEKVRRIDSVSSFSGIMNGTTNYLVDTMAKTGKDFDVVLREAQALGYAERDPSDDIDGIDVRNKTIIAASVAFNVACKRDIPTAGIRNLTKADMQMFGQHGRVVKLIGHGVQRDGHYAAAVEPVALSQSSLEAHVPANFNLVSLEGSTVGPLKFYGQGAGSLPTGNAMAQDVLDFQAGRRPVYDFSAGLEYDPMLLVSNYVFRTAVAPEGSERYDEGSWLVRSVTAAHAQEIFTYALESDPTSFYARLPWEDEA